MATVLETGLAQRTASLTASLGQLAQEHFRLSQRLKAIEVEMGKAEGAQMSDALTRKDMNTQAAIDDAQAATDAAQAATDAAQTTEMEVVDDG